MSQAKHQSNSQGKSTRKAKPLELRASVPWKSNAIVMSLLMARIPQYQVFLREKDTAKKRQWMEETEGEVVAACPQAWVVRWGTDHLRKSCRAWFNNNRTWGQDEEEAHASDGGEAGSSALPVTRKKTVAATAKTVLGNAEDNPLAKALRTRKVSPMRLWGSAHNERVQKMALTCSKSKIAAWSYCASQIWQKELSDEERAEWTQKANEVDVSDDQQCFRNQLGISPLLAGLMTGLIGLGATQIGKAVFSLRIAYRTADGQMMFEDQSLAEDQDSPDFIPFAHFEGGNPAEEDERWMRWTHKYVGPNPQTLSTELLYDERGARLPQFTGTKDVFWTRKVLREYFDVQWDVSDNERSPEWWKAVLTSPDDYVDEEWVADFRADPFELNAGGITILYIKLYDAEAKGSPFRFKHVSVTHEVMAEAMPPTSTSSHRDLLKDEPPPPKPSQSLAHEQRLPDTHASVTQISPSGTSLLAREPTRATSPPVDAVATPAETVHRGSHPPVEAEAAGGAREVTVTMTQPSPQAQPADRARSGSPVDTEGSAREVMVAQPWPLDAQIQPADPTRPGSAPPVEAEPAGSVHEDMGAQLPPSLSCVQASGGVHPSCTMGKRASSVQPQRRPPSVTPPPRRGSSMQPDSRPPSLLTNIPPTPTRRTFTLKSYTPRSASTPSMRRRSESPTRRFSRGSDVPALVLEKIREENDDMDEDLQSLPDATSSGISTPLTIASWLDPNACDIHDPTAFTELLREESVQTDNLNAPAEVQPPAAALAPTSEASGQEASINDGGAGVGNSGG